jgi:hypothetical protein
VSASAASATTLRAVISDNESWSVQGKYTYEFGDGFKDGATGAKLIFYGGYENISFANPDKNPANFIGETTVGGYLISAVTLNPYQTDKVLQLAWTGAKVELPSGWSFTGAYYHVEQNAFLGTVSKTGGRHDPDSGKRVRLLQRRLFRHRLPLQQTLRCVCRR